MPADSPSATIGQGLHWYAPPLPETASLPVTVPVQPFATGFTAALARRPAVRVLSPPLNARPPRALSVVIPKSSVKIEHFQFEEPTSPLVEAAPAAPFGSLPARSRPPKPATAVEMSSGVTRIRPPSDVIKLADRLRYVLQPSLEQLLAERSLSFPFRPFPYQLDGVAFLYPRQAAVLADEMGLGKTMQAITAIRLLLHCGEAASVLMVCPKPLVSNWQREFSLWAPEVPTLVIEGNQAKRRWQWHLAKIPVKIANYEVLRRDWEVFGAAEPAGEKPLRFDLVVLDESQRIKNRSGATSEVVRSIRRRRSWALTGTPIENTTDDLVGIFEFLVPGHLTPAMRPRRMARAVRDYVLRRTKDNVLSDLPPKLIRDAHLDLTPEQHDTYQTAEEEGVLRLSDLGAEITIQHVFELVLRLKQICNFDPATGASAKLERLEADLEEVAGSGRKAIVFSQWVKTLQQLARQLRRFGPLEYHGQVPHRQRDAVLRRFRDDPQSHVLLLSYGAGGVGLNLQFTNYVFLFDRWWNPAVEDQAINRAHRVGSTAPVTVTRLLTVGTIEERIDQILEQKRELFETIFAGGEARPKLGLTRQEIFGLFDLQTPQGPIPWAA